MSVPKKLLHERLAPEFSETRTPALWGRVSAIFLDRILAPWAKQKPGRAEAAETVVALLNTTIYEGEKALWLLMEADP